MSFICFGVSSHHFNSINSEITSSENLKRIILAGIPPTIAYGGTSLFTKLKAAITVPCPIVTPDFITLLAPTHTSLPIDVFLLYSNFTFRLKVV